jgi:hypothetical protein
VSVRSNNNGDHKKANKKEERKGQVQNEYGVSFGGTSTSIDDDDHHNQRNGRDNGESVDGEGVDVEDSYHIDVVSGVSLLSPSGVKNSPGGVKNSPGGGVTLLDEGTRSSPLTIGGNSRHQLSDQDKGEMRILSHGTGGGGGGGSSNDNRSNSSNNLMVMALGGVRPRSVSSRGDRRSANTTTNEPGIEVTKHERADGEGGGDDDDEDWYAPDLSTEIEGEGVTVRRRRKLRAVGFT